MIFSVLFHQKNKGFTGIVYLAMASTTIDEQIIQNLNEISQSIETYERNQTHDKDMTSFMCLIKSRIDDLLYVRGSYWKTDFYNILCLIVSPLLKKLDNGEPITQEDKIHIRSLKHIVDGTYEDLNCVDPK